MFDDATSDDPLRSIIGVAHVPLAGLAQGVPVEGAFKVGWWIFLGGGGVVCTGLPDGNVSCRMSSPHPHAAQGVWLCMHDRGGREGGVA